MKLRRLPPLFRLPSVCAFLFLALMSGPAAFGEFPESSADGVHRVVVRTGDAVAPDRERLRIRRGQGSETPQARSERSSQMRNGERGTVRTLGTAGQRPEDREPVMTPAGFAREGAVRSDPMRDRTRTTDYQVGIYSHYGGFVTMYPHDDGPSYDYYNSTGEMMPVWGMASGGPSPGVQNAVWVGGDFDASIEPCGGSCWGPPPVDDMYRGWRTQGYSTGPCNCPEDFQRAHFSANRGIMMFDLSYIPDAATIAAIGIETKVAKEFGSGERVNVSQIEADRFAGYENVAGTGFEWAYDDAADGNLYDLQWDVSPYATGNTVIEPLDNGTYAVQDVQGALARNWFGLGLVSGIGETSATSYYFGAFEGSSAGTPPMLLVDYHYCLPSAPVSIDNAQPQCVPDLTWDIPDEEDGNDLHFEVWISDTGPVYYEDYFTDDSNIDWTQTSWVDMVKTSVHDVYDAYGTLEGTDTSGLHMDPFELEYGGGYYPYAKGYNVGWRFSRPFVSHWASDTWTGGGYSADGLGDAMIGREYMEWSSVDPISWPSSQCGTDLGYSASVTGIAGYISSGITESFGIYVDYSDVDPNIYWIADVTNASGAFEVLFDPPIDDVITVACVFDSSSDGYAYMADLQVFDTPIYDTEFAETVTSQIVADTGDPSIPIDWIYFESDQELPAGTAVEYEVSNDDGATWHAISGGGYVTFPSPGHQLRWRAHLLTSVRSVTPKVTRINILNLLNDEPVSSYLDPTHFEENAAGLGVWQPMPSGGVPEDDGGGYRARYFAQGLGDGTYYWTVRAIAPAGSGDAGPLAQVREIDLDSTDEVPPPEPGNVLRATRLSDSEVALDWSLYALDPTAFFRVYRGLQKDLGDASMILETEYMGGDDTAAFGDLLFYRITTLDDCGNETALP